MPHFTKFYRSLLITASLAIFASGANAQAYDLDVDPSSGIEIKRGKQYVVTISCSSGLNKQTPREYLGKLNAKGEYSSRGSRIFPAKAASLWISIGSENLKVVDGAPSIPTSLESGHNSGIDSISIPVYALGIGGGPDFVKHNDNDCSRAFMVTGRDSQSLVVNATFTVKAGWDYEADADPVSAVFEFADESLEQAGKFIDGTSLVKVLPRLLFNVNEEEKSTEFLAERGEAANGFAAAWIKLAKTFGDEGFYNDDMELRVGENVVENRYARVVINVKEVPSFIHSGQPFTTSLETEKSYFWPLQAGGQPRTSDLFQNPDKIKFPERIDHKSFSTLANECDSYIQGLNRKGLTSKADQAYVLARLLSSDSLSQIAAMRCFHSFEELRKELYILRGKDYARKQFTRPDVILFNRTAYNAARAQLVAESNPTSPLGTAKPTPLGTEAEKALTDFYLAFNLGRRFDTLDRTLSVLDSARILNVASETITGPDALGVAFRKSGYNRANCYFVNSPENVSSLGETYFAGDVDGIILFHRLPSLKEVDGNIYRPTQAVVAQVTVNPLTKRIWRIVTTELDPSPLFLDDNVCGRKRAPSRKFEDNFAGMLENILDIFVFNIDQENKVREFEASVAENVRLIDPQGFLLTDTAADQRNVVMPRSAVFAAMAHAGFRGFSCGVTQEKRGAILSHYFNKRPALFILHKSRFAPSSDDATIVLVDGDADGKVSLLDLVPQKDLEPSLVLEHSAECGPQQQQTSD